MSYHDYPGRRRLYRGDGIFFGVCEGIADYFDFSPWGVRELFILGGIFTAFFPVLIVYIVLAMTLKRSPRYWPSADRW